MSKKKQDNEFGFFEIDPDRLEEEWVSQPRIFFAYGRKLALARKRVAQRTTELSLTRTEAAAAIRKSPRDYSLSKVTDKAVGEIVEQLREVKLAVKDLEDAKHRVAILAVAVEAMDHRKKALENVVKLRLAEFYSGPSTGSDHTGEEVRQAVKKRKRRPEPEDDDD